MTFATLTSKGQITLPKAVRTQLNLRAGDQLRFEAQPDGTLIGRPATRSALALIGLLKLKGQKPMSVVAIDRAIASGIAQKHRAQRVRTKKPAAR
jgi:antitoxin PrlF